jgi:RES domain-containing protein
MFVFRMHDPAWEVFDTGGAMRFRGRSHSVGTQVVYAAENISLAALELLVHSAGRRIPPRGVATTLVPDSVFVERHDWAEEPDPRRSEIAG